MNWGKGIFITVTVFVILVLSVVSYLISLDFYMVSSDHYSDAVEYQDTIDSKDRVKALSQPVVIFYDEKKAALKLVFPPELAGRNNEGIIKLYRPNDSEMDVDIELDLDQQGIQWINAAELEQGKWIMKLNWTTDSLDYSDEKNLLL